MVSLKQDGRRVVCVSLVFITLDIIAVGLRFVAKRRTKKHYAMDDFLMLVALLFDVAWTVVMNISLSSMLVYVLQMS